MNLNIGEIIVHKYGKDKRLYNVMSLPTKDGNVNISDMISRNSKQSQIGSLRIAEDEEIMIGYRMN